ncbi:hypothetical protein [Ruegeria jejuensis]|uniref:hypothetical protein n=1 Tax=Ruegeria jejuensis TaxID=3233338 RepID=UPI00355BB57B
MIKDRTAIPFKRGLSDRVCCLGFNAFPLMGLLAVVNLVALTMLIPIVLRLLGDFRKQLNSGVERPVFDPEGFPDLDIDRDSWSGAREADGG